MSPHEHTVPSDPTSTDPVPTAPVPTAPLPAAPVLADPLLSRLAAEQPVVWVPGEHPGAGAGNGKGASDVGGPGPGVHPGMVQEAAERFDRFAPWLAQAFPETAADGGLIESPLQPAEPTGRDLGVPPGRLWLKRDDILPVSGSVKARGGVHEVLAYAESVLRAAGRLGSGPVDLTDPRARELLAGHRVVVGSTGNLGIAVGVTAAALGMSATVHMSVHAREWKKQLLRERGVRVVEHRSDYTAAVAEGRRAAEAEPTAHFVDDENSRELFAGYAVAGRRLARQLAAAGVAVDAQHPLYLHVPCGIGGAPGGIAYGAHLEFGAHVHPVFVEPTRAPCMLLGVYTGRHDAADVSELGLHTDTVADGLAVGRPSGFVGRAVAGMVTGYLTVTDERMLELARLLYRAEGIFVEPSAAAALAGAERFARTTPPGATHVAWLTGGGMVPKDARSAMIALD